MRDITFDSLDGEIFRVIFSHGYVTTSDIAKILFSPKDKNELRKKTALITYRIKKYEKLGLLEVIENNGRKTYRVKPDNFFIALKIGNKLILL